MKKRLLSIILAIVMVFSMVGFAFATSSGTFSDVKQGQWYYEYVEDVAGLGYFIGYPDGTFHPSSDITRAEVVLVLARMAQRLGLAKGIDLNAPIDEAPFEDVSTNQWYSAAVKWAADEEITLGMGNNKFAPRNPITREDACTLIYRFINYVGEHLGTYYTKHYNASLIYEFEDEALIRDYAVEAVDVCMAYGLVEGFTDHSFQPRSNWTRAQGAKMISILHDVLDVPDTPVIPDPPVVTPYTAALQYVVDGEVVKTETQQSYSNNFTWTVLETVDILGTETYTNDAGTEYAIIGWSKSEAAAVVDNVAGDTFGSAAGTVKRYAVLVPVNDYIKLAILGLIDDVNGYAGKIEDTTVSDGYYDLHVGEHLDFADAYLDTGDNTVYVAATGTLNSETVTELLELATGYAVSLLSYEKQLPTEEEIMDIVTDVAGSVGIDIDGKTAEEIAEDIYADIEKIGNELFDNFKNYNGGLCIEAVTLMNGDKVVGTLDIGTQDKLDEAAAKDLAIAIAKQIWDGMKTQTGSEIDLHFAVTLVFDPVYNSQNNDTYVLDVTLTLASDMYHYDGTTNTLTFIIKEDLQAQYAESVEAIVSAAWGNIDNLYKDATGEETGVTDMLKEVLVDVLTGLDIDKAEAEAAADAWIAANMMVENPDETIASLYEFLWTMEGKPVDGVTVGDNTALHESAEDFYSDKLTEVIGSIDAATLGDLVAGYDVTSYLNAWIVDNTDPDNTSMFSLYNFLYKGNDPFEDTKLGDNDALYALVEYIFDAELRKAITGVKAEDISDSAIDAMKDILGEAHVNGKLAAALAVWGAANTDETNPDSVYSVLYGGSMITAAPVGVNGALYTVVDELCQDLADKITVDSLDAAQTQYPHADAGIVYDVFVANARAELTQVEYKNISDEIKAYLLYLCQQKAVSELGMDPETVNYDEAGNEWIAPMVDDILNDKLNEVINDPTKPASEWLGKDLLGRATKVDAMVTDKVREEINKQPDEVTEWIGLDAAERAAKIDEMVLETLLTFEYEGTNLVETVAKAAELKTIERLSDDVTLKVFSDLLKNSAVQDLAVEHIGDKVTYLVDYIDAIPAGISVSIDGVVYSAAELQDLKAAAAAGDAEAVCDELADLLGLIGYISMADMANGNTIEIVVNDGSYEYAMNFALVIE